MQTFDERLGLALVFARHFAHNVNVVRLDADAGIDADVLAGPVGGPDVQPDVVDQQFEVLGFVAQRVGAQPVGERQEAVREVVLGQPRHYAALLHVRPPCYVYDEVAQLLPVPDNIHSSRPDFGISARHRDGRRERPVDAEDDGLRPRRKDGHVEVDISVVSSHHHFDGIQSGRKRRKSASQLAGLVRHFSGDQIPFAVGGVAQEMDVHLLASQRHHIQRAVHEPIGE